MSEGRVFFTAVGLLAAALTVVIVVLVVSHGGSEARPVELTEARCYRLANEIGNNQIADPGEVIECRRLLSGEPVR